MERDRGHHTPSRIFAEIRSGYWGQVLPVSWCSRLQNWRVFGRQTECRAMSCSFRSLKSVTTQRNPCSGSGMSTEPRQTSPVSLSRTMTWCPEVRDRKASASHLVREFFGPLPRCEVGSRLPKRAGNLAVLGTWGHGDMGTASGCRSSRARWRLLPSRVRPDALGSRCATMKSGAVEVVDDQNQHNQVLV